MSTYPVEVYIYELSQESQTWCRAQFLQVLPNEEDTLHSSVVVHGVEYSYGEDGIVEQEPKVRPQYLFDDDCEEAFSWKKTVGKTNLTKEEVETLIGKLKKDGSWFSYKYNPVEHNCHHFADTLVKELCGDVVLPEEVYEFNRRLLSYRESWIDEFCGDK